MAGLGDLLKRLSHYTLANLAIMAAGLVSFPILTRVLSVAEYGIMGLIVMLITFLNSVAKAGLQHSSVRLWPEWERREGGLATFGLTLFVAALSFALATLVLYNGAVVALRPLIGERLAYFIALSSPLLVIQSVNSYGLNLLRARELSGVRAGFDVATAYVAMILAVVGATLVLRGLRGYYLGLMAGQALVSLALLGYVLRWTRFRRASWSPELLRAAIAYGLPMALAELCGAMFHMADRIIIQWLLDETAVGYYTMAFNLAMYVNMLFTMPMDMAAIPMYSGVYEREGAQAASEFLRKATRFFFLFALPAIAGVTVVREDVVQLLASKQFLPGASLVNLLLAGFLLYGSRTLLAAGMLLKKRVWLVAWLELAGAALNVGLNLILIPRFGIHGSAYATLATQIVGALVFYALGARLVFVPVDLLALLRHGACAVAMGLCIHHIRLGPVALQLGLRVCAGAALYLVLLVACDREVRAILGRLRARRN
jgi:O-antigen/teichoic acid export membrane protein